MEALLDQSELVNAFSEVEQAEARDMLAEKYEIIYNMYTNTEHPTEDLMEKVIDMYLFLNVTPPFKLLCQIKEYANKCIIFSKLDIYTHIPEYDQLVKLLRPEYYVEVDKSKFYIFTVSKEIYNLATEKYEIPDSYENTYSLWYLKDMFSTLGRPDVDITKHCVTHNLWDCISYLEYMHIDVIYAYAAIRDIIKDGNVDLIWYILKKTNYITKIVATARQVDNIDVIDYLGPLMTIEDDPSVIIKNRNLDAFKAMLRICPRDAERLIPYVIAVSWVEGVRCIVDSVFIDMDTFFNAIICRAKPCVIEMLYNKLLFKYTAVDVLNSRLCTKCYGTFTIVYKLNPLDLRKAIDIGNVLSLQVLDMCIRKGCTVTEEDVIKAIRNAKYTRDPIAIRLVMIYGNIPLCFMTEATKDANVELLKQLKNKGGKLTAELLNVALQIKNYYLFKWLIDNGCSTEALIDNRLVNNQTIEEIFVALTIKNDQIHF